MGILIKDGIVVTADQEYKSDIYCEGEQIKAIGENLEVPADTEIIDAKGCYVMPGGIDPQTHMQMPFMGTNAVDDFYSGTAAMMAGGTTMLIDFVIPQKGQSPIEAYDMWRGWAEKAAGDYSFHVAVTWWSDLVKEEMREIALNRGVNSFKHFMAYKGAIMADDEILVQSFSLAKELGVICTVHAENGDLVEFLRQKVYDDGIHGPMGHALSRPPAVEAEACYRAIRIAQMIGVPLYVVHTSSKDASIEISRARIRGQEVYSEVLVQHLVIDEEVYNDPDWNKAAHYVMSPPFRSKDHQDVLWAALASGNAQTTATDHCTFMSEQKAVGRDDFRKIPNGVGALEDRLRVLWHEGVNKGRLTRKQFVAITSTNTAKIFNIYPKKGCLEVGSDADIIVWDPSLEKVISQKTQHQKVDFNLFEGMKVKGDNKATILRGKITFLDGVLTAERGYGQYIDRPLRT